VHCWFVVADEASAECHRWEVWQTQNAGGRSIGHVHCDLKRPGEGVGGGPSRIIAEWRGDAAARIGEVLRDAARYPHCGRYRMWPGPNSNTFVAWVLEQAGVALDLGWRAIGRRFR
jgi:hypothetical protein